MHSTNHNGLRHRGDHFKSETEEGRSRRVMEQRSARAEEGRSRGVKEHRIETEDVKSRGAKEQKS